MTMSIPKSQTRTVEHHSSGLIALGVGGGVVRRLLARDDVNPDMPENGSRKPVGVASLHGHMEIVALRWPRTTAIASVD